MTPIEVKQAASSCSCPVCNAIIQQDLYVGKPAVTGTPTTIRTHYNGKPCQHCGVGILAGTTVIWLRGKGVYHPNCWEQRHEL